MSENREIARLLGQSNGLPSSLPSWYRLGKVGKVDGMGTYSPKDNIDLDLFQTKAPCLLCDFSSELQDSRNLKS